MFTWEYFLLENSFELNHKKDKSQFGNYSLNSHIKLDIKKALRKS